MKGSNEEPVDPLVIYRSVTRKNISRFSYSGIIVKLCFTTYAWPKYEIYLGHAPVSVGKKKKKKMYYSFHQGAYDLV